MQHIPKRQTYLDAEVAPVDVITQEKVAGICWITANLEKFHEVKILAVHVTTNCDGRIHFQKIRLALQDFGTLFDYEQCLLLGQASFAVEMLFQVLEIWLGAIMRRVEMVLRRRVEGWCLDVYLYAMISGAAPKY